MNSTEVMMLLGLSCTTVQLGSGRKPSLSSARTRWDSVSPPHRTAHLSSEKTESSWWEAQKSQWHQVNHRRCLGSKPNQTSRASPLHSSRGLRSDPEAAGTRETALCRARGFGSGSGNKRRTPNTQGGSGSPACLLASALVPRTPRSHMAAREETLMTCSGRGSCSQLREGPGGQPRLLWYPLPSVPRDQQRSDKDMHSSTWRTKR